MLESSVKLHKELVKMISQSLVLNSSEWWLSFHFKNWNVLVNELEEQSSYQRFPELRSSQIKDRRVTHSVCVVTENGRVVKCSVSSL